MNQIYCCKSCKKSYPGCHDTCVKYLAESLAAMDKKMDVAEEKKKDNLYVSYKSKRRGK